MLTSAKRIGENSNTVLYGNSNQNIQTSQKDFILIIHSKSVYYGNAIQVMEYKYHER